MSESIDSIASRTLAEWLRSYATILEGEQAKLDALGVGQWSDRAEEVHAVARWLDDAKFEVRDPWRLRVAVRDVLATQARFRDTAYPPRPPALTEMIDILRIEFEPYKGNL